jgi:hypothetical protein
MRSRFARFASAVVWRLAVWFAALVVFYFVRDVWRHYS